VLATIEIIANDTTALSTHVLPTKDQLERADVTLWDFLSPRVAAQHTPRVVGAVGDRRSTWWVLAELARRLGHELADTGGPAATDEAQLARITAGARCTFDELVATGWVETPRELPARWVDEHIDRLGGWRLAPQLLVDQLAALDVSAPLVLAPRRQPRRLNSQFEYLGEPAEIVINPVDATAAGVLDGHAVVVRSAHGELVGTAKVDASVRAGVVSVPHGHQGVNVNVLTGKDEIDPVTGMARYSGVPVSVAPETERSMTPQP
jgi:anaerobic selenocysteine-containing dehydrogenase